MRDVIGYEEKEPRVINALQSGYPRFFENPLVTKLSQHFCTSADLGDSKLFLCADGTVASRLLLYAGSGRLEVLTEGSIYGVSIPTADSSACLRAKNYLKRSGCALSSRVAEKALLDLGLINALFEERRFDRDAEAEVLSALSPILRVDSAWMMMASSGMNAFFATYQAISSMARLQGRRRWVRLGWLYVDTMDIIDQMGDNEQPAIVWEDLNDLDGLRKHLSPMAEEIAGIIVEVPTNPFFEHVDMDELVRLAKEIGARLVVDPSLVSIWNAPDWEGADILVSSLTKYAAGAGDVLGGVLAVNSSAEEAGELRAEIEKWLTPLAAPDLARLAAQVSEAPEFVSRVNEILPQVVEFLRGHTQVDRVWCPDLVDVGSFKGPGAVCSFTVKGEMRAFYDALEMAKGPSFGTNFTLISPYMWLAHYGMIIQSKASVDAPAGCAIDYQDLLRLSVGHEGAEAIIAVLERAFALTEG